MPPESTLTTRLLDAGAPAWAIMMAEEVGGLKQTIGVPSDDGKSGSGLVGKVNDMGAKMDGLMSLKTLGIGALGGIALVLAIVVFGLKGTFAAVLGIFGVKV